MRGEPIDIGGGHKIRFSMGDAKYFPELFPTETELQGLWPHRKLVLVGLIDEHLNAKGEPCIGGYVAFCAPNNPSEYEKDRHTWKVLQLDPLTLDPSLQCTACPAHGYIRNGRREEVGGASQRTAPSRGKRAR